jgi:hypothetical protein
MAHRTRLTPAELYLRPPVIDAVECPLDLMAAFRSTPPPRRPAVAQPLPSPPPGSASPRPRPLLPPGWRIIEGGRW